MVFEIDVPPESLENNNVPRYQLVKLCTRVGANIAKSNRKTLCPPMVSPASCCEHLHSLSLSFSTLPEIAEIALHQFGLLTQRKKASGKVS